MEQTGEKNTCSLFVIWLKDVEFKEQFATEQSCLTEGNVNSKYNVNNII